MRHLLSKAAILLVSLLAFTSAGTYYVTPTADTSCPERDVPCFTLSQYANKSSNYFTSNSLNTTLILLPGNHSLDSEFGVSNISNLAIIKNYPAHSDSDTYITCSQSARFTLNDIDAASLRELVLIGCMNNVINSVNQFTLENCSLQGQGRNGTGLDLNWVTSVYIVRSFFSSHTGEDIWDQNRKLFRVGGAIIIRNSSVTISCSIFTNNIVSRENERMFGGAIYAMSSNTTIHTSTFNNNTVSGDGPDANGGAMYARSSSITIHNTTFNNNTVTGNGRDSVLGGAVYAWLSGITIHNTTFDNNTASGDGPDAQGGAMHARSSNVTIHNTIFNKNIVTSTGEFASSSGVVYATSSIITIHTSTFNNNTVTGNGQDTVSGGAVYAWLSNITIHNTTFNNNTASGNGPHTQGGAMYARSSSITIHNTTFNNNTVTGNGRDSVLGGAVYAWLSGITIRNTTFNNNTASGNGLDAKGGAMYARSSSITIHNTTFNNNTVTENGRDTVSSGAVCAESSGITIHTSKFNNSHVITATVVRSGGAVFVWLSNITVNNTIFNNNTAAGNDASGGAVCARSSTITIDSTTFNNNTVTGYNGRGGAMYLQSTPLNSAKFLVIKNNMADIGGALYIVQGIVYFSGNTTILNNYGSVYAYSCNVTFMGHTNIINNSYCTKTSQEGGAVTAIQSQIVFTGKAYLSYNTAAMYGGGISVTQSKLYVYENICITHNTAISGGGIYAYQSEVNFEKLINISNNNAADRGGGIHAVSSIIRMTDHSKTYLVGNYAKRGGGVCLEMYAKLYFITEVIFDSTLTSTRLKFTENSADYGGALYITDDTNSGTCHATLFSRTKSTFYSECFMQRLTLTPNVHLHFPHYNSDMINFTNNSARKVGNAIYGGLLDRCSVSLYSFEILNIMFTASSLNAMSYIQITTNLNIQDSTKTISSDPVHVCFCRDNQPDCSYHPQPLKVRKGETFKVSLVAVDQINNTRTNSKILSYLSAEAGLGEGQSNQTTGEGCTELTYTVTSPHTSELLKLYADGPCKNIGISLQIVNIRFTACPIGFKDTGTKCDCDPELTQYISNCSITTESVLRKGNVWVAFMNSSENKSVVTYPNCPFDYCYPSTEQIRINVDISDGADKQCAFNRSGKLCGSCKDGLSLSLGSSRCIPCSNSWLTQIIVFAIAGITLVPFLIICNLTVAAGTVNGLLFYANVVSSNKATFFPNSTNRFLSIFIAWLNLDYGFETCFFNGLNGYWKTWLQLAFPTYVIFLVVLIIKACEYSFKFAQKMRLIARNNPVATLDTLVLLSYTKFIRMIISAWQFATLEYSDGRRETVWLVDGNIKYFELKHIPLFIVALVVLTVALIYTLLMFFWQWLLLCPNRRPVRWIRNSKLHGIMDAYFITFNKNHRYWTGLLLLARVLLYLVSALNGTITSNPRTNLFATSCVVGTLILWTVLTRGRIYRKWPLIALDSSFLFNLLMLAIATLYTRDVGGNQAVVVTTSVSIAFITFILIISYHVYAFVIPNQIMTKLLQLKKGNDSHSQQVQNVGNGTSNDDNEVTVSVVDVPLIPMDTEEDEMLPDGFDADEELDGDSNLIPTAQPAKVGHKKTYLQCEMEQFAGDNSDSNASNLQEVTSEEGDTPDYDELAPLLPLYNTA